jgi:hypothetical protein
MKPLAIDLFCGKGGWTNALLDVGFRVMGFDINPQPEYRGEFIQCNVLDLNLSDCIDFAVCSSPCEQFSVHCMKHFHPNPAYPALAIELFNHARNLLESLGIPYVMENVRCAEKFIGRAVNHCGPFYLWGNAVPALFSKECYAACKGMSSSKDEQGQRIYATAASRMTSTKRKTVVSVIPYPIALAVAEAGMRLVEAAA